MLACAFDTLFTHIAELTRAQSTGVLALLTATV